MGDLSWKEVLVVAVVGAGLAFAGTKVPGVRKLPGYGLLLGAGLYTVGYVAATRRPDGGWPQLAGPR